MGEEGEAWGAEASDHAEGRLVGSRSALASLGSKASASMQGMDVGRWTFGDGVLIFNRCGGKQVGRVRCRSLKPALTSTARLKREAVMSEEIISSKPVTRQRRKGRRPPEDGEVGIRYGNRNYIRSPDQALIAKKEKWHFVVLPTFTNEGWMNFKLYLDKKKVRKNMWGLGFYRGQFTRTHDLGVLKEHNPEMVEWALEKARRYAAGELAHKPEQGTPVVYRKGKGWFVIKKASING